MDEEAEVPKTDYGWSNCEIWKHFCMLKASFIPIWMQVTRVETECAFIFNHCRRENIFRLRVVCWFHYFFFDIAKMVLDCDKEEKQNSEGYDLVGGDNSSRVFFTCDALSFHL